MKRQNVTAHLLCSGVLVGFLWVAIPLGAKDKAPLVKELTLNNGVALHYVEQGTGAPVIFVHGSLSDYTYWKEQVDAFAKRFHVIDYSRRYNWPNENKTVPN
jgi:hypothetical protein